MEESAQGARQVASLLGLNAAKPHWPRGSLFALKQTWRSRLVPGAGFEPALPYGNWILSPKRLPFRHPGEVLSKNIEAIETRVFVSQGHAIMRRAGLHQTTTAWRGEPRKMSALSALQS